MEPVLHLIVVALLSLCWGSFLASFSWRIAFDQPLFASRSYCPSCQSTIFWYDNFPVFSWLLLSGSCRQCSMIISSVYPFIETLTACFMTILFYKMFLTAPIPVSEVATISLSFFFYTLFFSALIGSTATDLFAMIIPQLFSIWLVPLGIISSLLSYTSISYIESILGALFGYGLLWFVAFIFKKYTNRDGIGQGDMELLCLIGSFTGIQGVWITLLLGSISGLAIGGSYLYLTKQSKHTHIPFGPFLAISAICYVLFKQHLVKFFLF